MKQSIALFLTVMLLLCALPAFGEEGTVTVTQEAAAPTEPVATASSQPSDAEPFSKLSYGSSGKAVRRVQELLTALGYYEGKVSGNYLDGTQTAISHFQRDYGLPVTGEVDLETSALLSIAEYRKLEQGDEGDDVKRLQERLHALGYFENKATGKYLKITVSSVKTFQQRNGLEVTGIADTNTQRCLFSDEAIAMSEPAATPTPSDPDSTPMPADDINDVVMVEDGAPSGDSKGEADLAYPGRLQRGSKGDAVKRVQTLMTELGYFDGPISGNYMNKTVTAVKKFQKNNGLEQDGVTGETTWNAMFLGDEAPVDAASTPRPTPDPAYAITVDVRNQAVLVYTQDESGAYTKLYKKMVCSTGRVGSPSDVGTWVLNGRRARWAYFSLYGSHAQFWTRINENIAFHSVIYNTVDTMNLSTKSYNKLGQRASHGCIRLLVSDAKWIYDNARKNTVVTITEDLPANEELRAAVKAPALNKSNMLPVRTPEPTPEPQYSKDAPPPQPLRKLKKNAEGEDVYWLQCKLQELGYYTGTPTGRFLGATQRGVKAYQRANKIYPSGEMTVEQLETLYADVLPTFAPESTATPEYTLAPSASLAPTDTVAP